MLFSIFVDLTILDTRQICFTPMIFTAALVRRPILPISSLVPAERGGSLRRSDVKTLERLQSSYVLINVRTYKCLICAWSVLVSLPPLKHWRALIASLHIHRVSAPIWQHEARWQSSWEIIAECQSCLDFLFVWQSLQRLDCVRV